MFPSAFADRVIRSYSAEGDVVLDPFAGRGTSIFSAATQRRIAVGIEINPVGFLYARTKLHPADIEAVEQRVKAIGQAAKRKTVADAARELPIFYRLCFSPEVRRFLVAARQRLDWRRSNIDRTAMAIILVYLHGKDGAALSNQMRQTKAMSPGYAINWWRERNLSPPEIDPVEFFKQRLIWRYAHGRPECEASSSMYLGDCLQVLPRLARKTIAGRLPKVTLLFTSPPYYGITNYHYDQWLRLWMLGGPPNAGRIGNGRRGKFEHKENYTELLNQVFSHAKRIMRKDATAYIRTDARQFTRDATIRVLKKLFPTKSFSIRRRPIESKSQTHLFGEYGERVGEVDLVLEPK
jgi:DNA modification methylase